MVSIEEIALGAKKVERLLSNNDFSELILTEFISGGIYELVTAGDLQNPKTIAELEARKILRTFIYDKIEQAEKLRIDLKD